jgi:xanthine dehydrogenase YagT iron-sulfur-binding subunit
MATSPSIGAIAPEFVMHGPRGALAPTSLGQPRVLAFVHNWSVDQQGTSELRAIRAQLRGLGAELIVLAASGVWSFHPDDHPDQLAEYTDRIAADIATAALLYGVRDGREAVFVIDEDGVLRFAHRAQAIGSQLGDAIARAACEMLAPTPPTLTRREWVASCLACGFALTFLRGCHSGDRAEPAPAPLPEPAQPDEVDVELEVNGMRHSLRLEPRVSLLDVLRERLGLTGTKKGCDMGQCGACTVQVGGKRVLSCLTLAVMAQGEPIKTIEGLADGDALHPVQAAFIEHDAFQCGFCTPGQIMSAVALLEEATATNDAEIREHMSGNLCRCGAYPNIVAAIDAARRRPR